MQSSMNCRQPPPQMMTASSGSEGEVLLMPRERVTKSYSPLTRSSTSIVDIEPEGGEKPSMKLPFSYAPSFVPWPAPPPNGNETV